jgi:two-component system, NarL family, sensor histidine kinase UhpB
VPRLSTQVSILWRVFTVNALVFGGAVLILIVSPATLHAHATPTELAVLVGGLCLTLLLDLVLLAAVLSPVRNLGRLMGDIDPQRPGRRASVGRWASSEAVVLARAFNGMLERIEIERRESARKALAAQEAERLRIARELHDEVGQMLTAISLRAEHAREHSSTQAQALGEIAEVTRVSLSEVRRIVRELRPEALDDLGLTDALIALCLRLERQGSTRIVRDLRGELPELNSDVELVIYRVAQEALTNALRHAQAEQVLLSLTSTATGVRLTVADDGCGAALEEPDGKGLAGMRERALLVDAELELTSVPGEGFQVTLTAPGEATSR